MRTTAETGTLAHIVWTEQIHLAPKGDGRLIVGATVEERGFDDAITAGGLYALLEGARRAFPAIEEMAVEAVWTGFRPSSIDDAPILGATPIAGLAIATGHHRNGYLLAPATALAIEALIADGAMPAVARAFGLDRFAAAAAGRARAGIRERNCPHEADRQRTGSATARRPISPSCGAPRPPTSTSPSRAALRSRSTAPWCAAPPGRPPRCATAMRSRSSAPCRAGDGNAALQAPPARS